MSFSFLLLGHLLGDFGFQTEKIALNKVKKNTWNALHAAIVTGSMLLFSLPFGLITMCLVLVNGILHYFIDAFKSKLVIKSPVHALLYFLTDQFIHITLILLISKLGEKSQSLLFINEKYIKILVIFLFVVFFMSIFIQYVLKILFPSNKHVFFLKHEKLIGDFTRFALLVIYMLSFWLSVKVILVFIPLVVILALLYHKRWNKFMSQRYYSARLMMDLSATTMGFYFLIAVYL